MRSSRTTAAAVVLFLCAQLLPRASSADEGLEAQTEAQAVAARRLEDAGDFVAALDGYEAIPEPSRSFLVRIHIARCMAKLGRMLAAVQRLEGIAADPGVPEAARDAAGSDLDELRARLPQLTVKTMTGGAPVSVALDGAEVSLPITRAVDPGVHVIVGTRDGHEVYRREARIAEGAKLTMEIDAPPVARVVDSGPRLVAVPHEASTGDSRGAGEAHGSRRTAAFIAFGIGGLFAGGAVGSYFAASHAEDQHKDACLRLRAAACPDDDAVSRMHRFDVLTYVAGGAALAAIGTGVVLLVTSTSGSTTASKDAGAATRVAVARIGASGGAWGVTVGGVF